VCVLEILCTLHYCYCERKDCSGHNNQCNKGFSRAALRTYVVVIRPWKSHESHVVSVSSVSSSLYLQNYVYIVVIYNGLAPCEHRIWTLWRSLTRLRATVCVQTQGYAHPPSDRKSCPEIC
jgi:hypothetical protein